MIRRFNRLMMEMISCNLQNEKSSNNAIFVFSARHCRRSGAGSRAASELASIRLAEADLKLVTAYGRVDSDEGSRRGSVHSHDPCLGLVCVAESACAQNVTNDSIDR
jgi:hypothetical protein